MSKFRKQVFAKTDGHCFYCGVKLGEKGWQEDHFHPVIRVGGKMLYPELDVLDNLVPSCAQCNNYKTSYPIEVYREVIQAAFKSVPKQSTALRQLMQLGLVDIEEKPVQFYFEQQGIEVKSEAEMIGLSKGASDIVWGKDPTEYNYYGARIGKFYVTLRHMGDYYLAIALLDWDGSRRVELPNGRLVKQQAAEWALRLNELEGK